MTPSSAPFQPAWAAPYDAGPGVGQKHRGAIGGQDGADDAGRGGDRGVALGPVALPAGPRDAGDGGMDLVAGGQIVGDAAQMFRNAAAVLGHGGGVIV